MPSLRHIPGKHHVTVQNSTRCVGDRFVHVVRLDKDREQPCNAADMGRRARSLQEFGQHREAARRISSRRRWFTDGDGVRWEARIVVHSEGKGPDRELVKFISNAREVREGDYDFPGGLGLRSDDELRQLLDNAV